MENFKLFHLLSLNLFVILWFSKLELGSASYRNIHDESRRLLMLIDPETLLHRCISSDVIERLAQSINRKSELSPNQITAENVVSANIDQLLAVESSPRESMVDVDYADSIGDDEPQVDYFDSISQSPVQHSSWSYSSVTPSHGTKTNHNQKNADQQQSESTVAKQELRHFTSNWSDRNQANTTGGSPNKSGKLLQLEKEEKSRPTSQVLNLPPVDTDWSFQCPPKESGYFADIDNDCRVYYVFNGERGERQRFQCPMGTRFNQDNKNCDWWDKVRCDKRQTKRQ